MDILFQCAKKPLINLLGKKSELTIFNNGQITLIKERIPFKKWPTLFTKRTEQTMFCKDIRFVTDVSNFLTHIVKRHKLYFGHKVQMHAPQLLHKALLPHHAQTTYIRMHGNTPLQLSTNPLRLH